MLETRPASVGLMIKCVTWPAGEPDRPGETFHRTLSPTIDVVDDLARLERQVAYLQRGADDCRKRRAEQEAHHAILAGMRHLVSVRPSPGQGNGPFFLGVQRSRRRHQPDRRWHRGRHDGASPGFRPVGDCDLAEAEAAAVAFA